MHDYAASSSPTRSEHFADQYLLTLILGRTLTLMLLLLLLLLLFLLLPLSLACACWISNVSMLSLVRPLFTACAFKRVPPSCSKLLTMPHRL